MAGRPGSMPPCHIHACKGFSKVCRRDSEDSGRSFGASWAPAPGSDTRAATCLFFLLLVFLIVYVFLIFHCFPLFFIVFPYFFFIFHCLFTISVLGKELRCELFFGQFSVNVPDETSKKNPPTLFLNRASCPY